MKTNNVSSNYAGRRFGTGYVTHLRVFLRRLAGTLPGVLLWLAVLPLAAPGQANYATPYTFITVAGNPGYGSADGTNNAAQFAYPCGVAVDSAGNLYVADTVNATIREVTPVGTNWVVTTLAGLAGCIGTNDGTGGAARFNSPFSVAVDSTGNLYVADTGNQTIRELTLVGTNWVVTTIAGQAGSAGTNDGPGTAAQFNGPGGVTVDLAGNVYVADTGSDTIRKITPTGTHWMVSTLAGLAGSAGSANGSGSAARFCLPFSLSVATNGNLYVADTYNLAIRKVTPAGMVTTLATGFNGSYGVAVDTSGNVYVADTGNYAIRKVTSGGTITTVAGSIGYPGTKDGTGGNARFSYPCGVAVDSAGNLYVADAANNTIREVTTAAGVVRTLAGLADNIGRMDGTGSTAQFDFPVRLTVDTNGNVYVSDAYNETIRKVTQVGANWVVTTLAGLAGISGPVNGTNSAARFNAPDGMAVDNAGNLYVSDFGDNTIREVTPVGTNWVVTTLAGLAGNAGNANGTGSAARFNEPVGVAVDNAGHLYVSDFNNDTIRKLTLVGTNWVVTTLAGLAGVSGTVDGTNGAARFNGPQGVAVDSAGNLYVADTYNMTIRKVTPVGTTWVVTTIAGLAGHLGSADGSNSAARFAYPEGVAADQAGNLYVADTGNNTIREVTLAGTNWVVTTLGGLAGYLANIDGTGSAARFSDEVGVTVDSAGNLYVADSANNTIRKGYPASSVPWPKLQPPSLSAGQFGFGMTGLAGLGVNIEASADLVNWQVVGAGTLAGGTNYFVNPAPSLGARFYRLQVR